MTALFGWGPALLTFGAMMVLKDHGARDWSDVTAFVVFGGLYLALIFLGARLFARWG